jgi:hypothetical protein
MEGYFQHAIIIVIIIVALDGFVLKVVLYPDFIHTIITFTKDVLYTKPRFLHNLRTIKVERQDTNAGTYPANAKNRSSGYYY